jgi:hypothetical protein
MKHPFIRTHLPSFTPVALGVLAFLGAGAAEAFTYATGDLVGIFVNAGTELEVDLGPLSSLTNGQSFTFQAPPQFAGAGAIGGTFAALQTFAPFTGLAPRSISYSTDPSVNPLSFDNKANYITKISPAQSSIDTGTGSGWLPDLNKLPPAGMSDVILNTPTELAIPTSDVNSWTSLIGPKVNDSLPFSTVVNLMGNGALVPVWTGTRTATTTTHTVEVGELTVDGNPSSDGSTVGIKFSVIPEPGTLWLLGAGLSGLAWVGRRQRKQ